MDSDENEAEVRDEADDDDEDEEAELVAGGAAEWTRPPRRDLTIDLGLRGAGTGAPGCRATPLHGSVSSLSSLSASTRHSFDEDKLSLSC